MSKGKVIESLDDLTPDPRNANRGTPRGRYMVEKSLGAVGAGRSIVVDSEGKVIAGNKTLEAAEAAGLEIEVVRSDGTKLVVVQRTDLTLDDPEDTRARSLAYFDNRASEVGLEWDPEMIAEDMAAGVNLEPMFLPDELDAFHLATPTPDEMVEKYGEYEERDGWPEVRVKVAPETYDAYIDLLGRAPGDDDAERFASLLAAVDGAALG